LLKLATLDIQDVIVLRGSKLLAQTCYIIQDARVLRGSKLQRLQIKHEDALVLRGSKLQRLQIKHEFIYLYLEAQSCRGTTNKT
jgi:hypothetical protein